ncbi:DEAD/DEAH box helicase [bacterium]|nr:DEAD/DEAH box helicase [bacterium]
MRISKISFEPNALSNIHKQQRLSSNKQNTQINPDKIFQHYLGREMVSFKGEKPFSQTLKENYFKLPQGFYPDDFQIEAGKYINEGKDVLVEAPTGTGKTAIAHYAVSRNMDKEKTTFYTTPLKALSNQKLNEFRSVYGEKNVGILTGDRRENVEAPILIMTTEVYRNMALSNKYGDKNPLMENLGTVIFDEFHYLGDLERGPVWEESLMYTPKGVQTLELSATIGNPKELESWINSLDENNAALVSVPPESRHVPLKFDMIETGAYKSAEKRINNAINKKGFAPEETTNTFSKPTLSDFKIVVNTLSEREQLPAILFVFSRKFSRELLTYLSSEGKSLTTDKEKEEIQQIINEHKSKKYLGSDLNADALKNGYAIHNAGIIPAQKELIEELFQKKLLKTVIATETLAAGINMPARTVVISSPYKPTDSDEEESGIRLLTSNEFKQMSGRAGRRGIDKIGYVYTMPMDKNAEQDFIMMEVLPSNPIESKFNPDYAFLSGYYDYNQDNSELKNIYSKTFYTHSDSEQEKEVKLATLMNISSQRTNVLKNRGFIKKENGEYSITQKGYMASKVRGYDTLTLVESIYNKAFKDITPEALAGIAAVIANPISSQEPSIGENTDLSTLVTPLESNIQRVYDKLNTSINSKLKKLGTSLDNFNSFEEILEFVSLMKKPQASEKELLDNLSKQEARRAKMYTITASSGNYTEETLLKALLNGETVPTKVLEKYSDVVKQYKNRMNTNNDIESYILKLTYEYEKQKSSAKGNKAKARVERAKAELQKKIKQANVMKSLDELIPDAIAQNFAFIKRNPPEQVRKDYRQAEYAYIQLTSKDELTQQINAVMSIEEYLNNNDLYQEGIQNLSLSGNTLNDIIKTALDINKTELENGITDKPQKYGMIPLKAMYSWAALNKMNKGSIYNWYELLKIIPEKDIDEGGLYRMSMQTADLLSQIGEIAAAGKEYSSDFEDEQYYSQLQKTAMQARNLLIKEPVTI